MSITKVTELLDLADSANELVKAGTEKRNRKLAEAAKVAIQENDRSAILQVLGAMPADLTAEALIKAMVSNQEA